MSKYAYPWKYDVIVVGTGHAGCEAALACSRAGFCTLLLTMNLDTIAQMSCNPAIGGLAKGHLVREIDALGGEMARIIDATGIQFRMLNRSKGPAVWSPRAQADKKAYQQKMRQVLEGQDNLEIKQDVAEAILVEHGKAKGVYTRTGIRFQGEIIIITTGTFLKGLIHIGETSFAGGRQGELPADALSESILRLGFRMGRLKTGTPPRISSRQVDFSRLQIQGGDADPSPFSFATEEITQEQIPCYISYTNPRTHELIRSNLDRSPLYSGKITGIGPRYCPSIEVKVVRFPDRDRHQIFLEPEGRNTREVYLNGLATSLPVDVQEEMVRSIRGLEKAEIIRFGYAIEYDFVPPTQIKPTLETKLVENLYFAGQINGTSGYEEAAAQGIMAGINGILRLKREKPLVLDRTEAYIGVLIDDLVTKGVTEPYRMFTSRAEYRLLLRQDNADLRLRKYGCQAGLVCEAEFRACREKQEQIYREVKRLRSERLEGRPLAKILRQPGVRYEDLFKEHPEVGMAPAAIRAQVEAEIKYEGYIKREQIRIARFRRLEGKRIPRGINYGNIKGLKKEAQEKLERIQPISLGQAARISGITPCDLSLLLVYLAQKHREYPRPSVVNAVNKTNN